MNPHSPDQLAKLAGAEFSGGPGPQIARVCTDSRTLQAGDLFVALRGEYFDGHAFVEEAAVRGAGAVMVDDDFVGNLPENYPVLRVHNTLTGLQTLASNYLRGLPLRVVGITGSNGKTSTKDFTSAVLGRRFNVLKTAGNLNNQIGLPLMLLRADDSHAIAVLEMGMSHQGDIAELVGIAPPEVAVLTGIGIAHLEFMKTREAIAQEKGRLVEAVPPEGMAVMPSADPFFESIRTRCKAPLIGAGFNTGDLRASRICTDFEGSRFLMTHGDESVETHIRVPGEHMVQNALLAVAVGLHFGLSLAECAEGLRDAVLTGGRLQIRRVGPLHVVDDTYNANPDSMVAALKTFAALPTEGRRIAVLGCMAEMGDGAEDGYRRAGATAAEFGVDALITVGPETAGMAGAARAGGMPHVETADDIPAAARLLMELTRPGDLLLLKGSRSAGMERLLESLAKNATLLPHA